MVSVYLNNYSSSFSGREIARRTGVSAQTALDTLHKLVQEKTLSLIKEGRNNKYILEKNNLSAKLFIELAEVERSREFLINFELKSIVESLIPYAETLIVFGSFAKGTQKEDSDIDLVMVNATNKEKIKKITRSFPREVNVEFVSWKEFAKSYTSKNALAIEIKKDHLLYGNVFRVVNIYSGENYG